MHTWHHSNIEMKENQRNLNHKLEKSTKTLNTSKITQIINNKYLKLFLE